MNMKQGWQQSGGEGVRERWEEGCVKGIFPLEPSQAAWLPSPLAEEAPFNWSTRAGFSEAQGSPPLDADE